MILPSTYPKLVEKIDPATLSTVQPLGLTGWTLTMSEEFESSPILLDAARGYVAFHAGGSAWRAWYPDYLMTSLNNQNPHTGNPQMPEQQYYDLSAISQQGSALRLTATRQPVQQSLNPRHPFKYISGNINSRDGHSQTYGFFEARMKLPATTAGWPAFWLFPYNWVTGVQVELDIMECFGDPNVIQQTNQMPGATVRLVKTNIYTGVYHTFGCEWTSTYVKFYVDGYLKATESVVSSIPTVPMYPILNLAVQLETVNPYPDLMVTEVDYIRCWK
jgi:beta-glucanase (GH16 family)